jgi:hypothetical protein
MAGTGQGGRNQAYNLSYTAGVADDTPILTINKSVTSDMAGTIGEKPTIFTYDNRKVDAEWRTYISGYAKDVGELTGEEIYEDNSKDTFSVLPSTAVPHVHIKFTPAVDTITTIVAAVVVPTGATGDRSYAASTLNVSPLEFTTIDAPVEVTIPATLIDALSSNLGIGTLTTDIVIAAGAKASETVFA